jgi:hypothetical protein
MYYNQLSIVTISKHDNEDLLATYNSILPLIENGAKWIVIISNPFNRKYSGIETEVIGKDKSLYNALNLGLDYVNTKFFMFLHGGDQISDLNNFKLAFDNLLSYDVCCVLGGAQIGNRKHHSFSWKPYMFKLYVQPPHLPILYKTETIGELRFDESIKIVSDFYFLRNYFLKIGNNYSNSKKSYVKMNTGGVTTSGLKSLLLVTNQFFKKDGILAYLLLPIRIIFKILLQ